MDNKTLILGNGPCAVAVAENLLTTGIELVIATTDDTIGLDGSADSEALQILTETRLISCKGSVGNFRVEAIQNNKPVAIDAGRIIIAEEDQRTSSFSLYGLKASSNVITLSQMKNLLHDSSREKSILSEIKKVVFLTGIVKESTPVIAKEVMLSSLLLQKDYNLQTYILTKNLKVAGDGLESLYRETKEAGTIYIKFTDVVPDIHQGKEDNIRIEFFDEITSKNIINAALDAGVNFIDCADAYGGGKTEEIVGRALKNKRDDLITASKCFNPMGSGPNDGGLSRVHIM